MSHKVFIDGNAEIQMRCTENNDDRQMRRTEENNDRQMRYIYKWEY